MTISPQGELVLVVKTNSPQFYKFRKGNMKKVKISVEFEVPKDFDDYEGIVLFVNGTMDNADYSILEDIGIDDMAFVYLDSVEEETKVDTEEDKQ